MVQEKKTLIRNKYELAAGVVLALLFSALFYLAGAPWQTAAGYAAAFLALGFLPLRLKGKWRGILAAPFALAAAILAVWLMQTMLSTDFAMVRTVCLPLGFVIAEALILLLILITGRFSVGVGVGTGLLLLLSTVDCYVLQFRGTEFLPYDILAARTAMQVADGYDFTPSIPLVTAWVQMALFVFVTAKLHIGKLGKRLRLRVCLPLTALCVLFSALGLRNVVPEYYSKHGAILNGMLVNFAAQVRDSIPVVPDHYDAQALENDAAQVKTSGRATGPTIIAIMNESFADLRLTGPDLKTDGDVMPFFDSLQENTIRGHALASVYGGGTANSEYEFLTGNTTSFFPRGSVPYAQYVKEDTYSLVRELHDRGYVCQAYHPYYSICWQRETVYPKLGFDEAHFIEDFPGQEVLRGFIGDREMYEKLIDVYEHRDTSRPLFLFGVTVQNHGGYSYPGEDFQSEIHAKGLSADYPDADQYLTLIRKSDDALAYLIDYFSSVDDDVVLVFFGDHFPSLSDAFYTEIHGEAFSSESLDEWEKQFMVPFVIWANYDIPEQEIGLTGLNYLTHYLYQAARIRPSAYSVMLSQIEKTIPAMNGYGYYSAASGNFLPFDQAQGEDLEALERYRQLQYNNTFDRQNRLPIF